MPSGTQLERPLTPGAEPASGLGALHLLECSAIVILKFLIILEPGAPSFRLANYGASLAQI